MALQPKAERGRVANITDGTKGPRTWAPVPSSAASAAPGPGPGAGQRLCARSPARPPPPRRVGSAGETPASSSSRAADGRVPLNRAGRRELFGVPGAGLVQRDVPWSAGGRSAPLSSPLWRWEPSVPRRAERTKAPGRARPALRPHRRRTSAPRLAHTQCPQRGLGAGGVRASDGSLPGVADGRRGRGRLSDTHGAGSAPP